MSVFLLFAACIENELGKNTSGDDGGPMIEVTPTSIDFGSLDPGDSATDLFTISSVGEVSLEVSEISLSSSAFSLVTTEGKGLLEPGQSVDIVVAYSPVNPTDTAWVVVRSDDPTYPESRVDLTGGAMLPGLTLDPAELSFGGLENGETATEPISMINSGEATLTIASVTVTGDGFTASFLESLPLDLAPGESRDVDITFAPTSQGLYEGTLWVGSNVASGVTSAPLSGQAGLPVAVCTVDPDVVAANSESATYIGTESYDPEGGAIVAYEWTLITAPSGSRASLTAGTDRVGISPDLAGIYEASLVVETELGMRSEPCIATLEAIPSQNLWIEMFWTHSGDDMDLHLVAPGGTLVTDTDCYYGNCVGGGLDWGTRGDSDDNPHLDIDDIPGTGPENINIASPADGVFTVYVHDYPGSVYQPDNEVTVRIYLGGTLAWEETLTISGENDYVPYAEIDWPDGTVTSL